MTFLRTAVATATLVMMGAGANAASFDFNALADSALGEGGWNGVGPTGSYAGGFFDADADTYTVDGVTVSASGYDYLCGPLMTDGDHFYFGVEYEESNAYLDSGNAG